MSVKNRLIDFIKKENLSVREFEKSIMASNGYINSISRSVGVDKISQIVENYPNINIDWLLTGRGEMTLSTVTEVSIPDSNFDLIWKAKHDQLKEKYVQVLEENNLLLRTSYKNFLKKIKALYKPKMTVVWRNWIDNT